MSQVITIADAVTTLITTNSIAVFGTAITATRSYIPRYSSKDMGTLHVTVVPETTDIERITRSQQQYTYRIDIAIQQQIDIVTVTDSDALVASLEALGDLLLANPNQGGASLQSIALPSLYVPDHMKKLRLYTGVVSAFYTEMR